MRHELHGIDRAFTFEIPPVGQLAVVGPSGPVDPTVLVSDPIFFGVSDLETIGLDDPVNAFVGVRDRAPRAKNDAPGGIGMNLMPCIAFLIGGAWGAMACDWFGNGVAPPLALAGLILAVINMRKVPA